jgi:hypothetical protein
MSDTLILHQDGMVSINDKHGGICAGSLEDSLDFLEWFTGIRSMEVFNESMVFNNDGRMVRLVKE